MESKLTVDPKFIPTFEDNNKKLFDPKVILDSVKLQLQEYEMMGSMYSNPGEFNVDDRSVVADLYNFAEGKLNFIPLRMDYMIKLTLEEGQLEIYVTLPLDYPMISEPDVYVRGNPMHRTKQQALNAALSAYIAHTERGEFGLCVGNAVLWLQDNAAEYFTPDPKASLSKESSLEESAEPIYLSRYWIYSHHIYSKQKRKEIMESSKELDVTGFCLSGKPGIICIEGLSGNCETWWRKVKSMHWQKIMIKKQETEKCENPEDLELKRRFKEFPELTFHFSDLYPYLEKHQSGYAFKAYFGIDPRFLTSSSS